MASTRPTVLIVDDEPFNVDFLKQELDDLGYGARAASNGQEALEMVAAERPDIILLDVMMPVMDGFQVLERLKGDPATRDIPVIVVSAMNELASAARGIQLGALDYLPKPVENALLRARLEAALAAKRARDQEMEYLERVGRVVSAATALEAGRFEPESLDQVASRPDSLGQLARVFQRMAREVALREQRLKQQLQQARQDLEEIRRAQSEPISVYLPMDRRQALARGIELPEQAAGSALFADISGFTSLTGRLEAELGRRRGAEELTRQLEQIYTTLISEVHRYGGSVIGFSGDAITCWFENDDGSRGIACALALQRAVQDSSGIVPPQSARTAIAIKVAVSAGKVRRFLVGDPEIQRVEVIAGRTLEQLAIAEQHASPGEVIVPAALVEKLSPPTRFPGWREDLESGMILAVVESWPLEVPSQPWPPLPGGALDEAQCRPWIYPTVYELVRSSRKVFLDELRQASVLFLLFKGIDYEGDSQAGAKLDAFIRWVQGVILRHEGAFVQLTIGDKGSYLEAVFGAPIAHPDDPARALRAARELLRIPGEMDFIAQMQIGIASGPVRAGAYGSPVQRTYGVMGDKVNLAARLMQAASGGILCDESTARAVQEETEFEALPPIQVKGKPGPVAVYRPKGQRSMARRRHITFIGRSAELELVRQSLENLQAGRSGALLVQGEAGMGKTRLLEELHQQCVAQRIQVYTQSKPVEPGRPYSSPWIEILRRVFNLDSIAEDTARTRRLGELIARKAALQPLTPLMNRFFPLGWPENGESSRPGAEPGLAPAGRQQAIRLLAELVLEAAGPDPIAILLDDAQDLDEPSWDLACALVECARPERLTGPAATAAPLLLAIAARPMAMPWPEAYLKLNVLPATLAIDLKPLPADDALLLARERLGVARLPDPVADLLTRASGNPYFILETVGALQENGALTVRGRDSFLAPGAELEKFQAPASVKGTVTGRLDRLTPAENLLLKVASVIGDRFSQPMLEAIYPMEAEKEAVGGILQSLEWLDLIAQVGEGPAYRFTHPVTRQLAYESMLFSQRRQLHRKAAEWYEARLAGQEAPDYKTLGEHWLKAGEVMKAIDYYEKAGKAALERKDYAEAERLFNLCLELGARAATLEAEEPGS